MLLDVSFDLLLYFDRLKVVIRLAVNHHLVDRSRWLLHFSRRLTAFSSAFTFSSFCSLRLLFNRLLRLFLFDVLEALLLGQFAFSLFVFPFEAVFLLGLLTNNLLDLVVTFTFDFFVVVFFLLVPGKEVA